MTERLYPKCRPWELEPYYCAHISAMTREGLHSKADITEQLAWRDKHIAFLEAAVEAANGTTERANALNTRMLGQLTRIREAAGPVREWLQQFPVAFYPDIRALLRAIDGEAT